MVVSVVVISVVVVSSELRFLMTLQFLYYNEAEYNLEDVYNKLCLRSLKLT